MGRITTTTIICDRCEKPMARECEDEWVWFDHKKKPFYKLLHEVPSWNRKDEFLLCEECSEEFRQWMLEKKSTFFNLYYNKYTKERKEN